VDGWKEEMTRKLIPQQRNANKHTLHGLRLLEKSIQSDGFIDAQTAAADGEIISGSARLELSAEKFADVEPIIVESDGSRPVVVVRTDIPTANDPRAKRLSVAANQIAKTDFNPDGELLAEWGGEDEAIRAMFADSEWEEITGEKKPTKDAEPQTDRAAELLEKWGVQPGDLWQIGDHRLICGDCTDAATVARVMGREKAGACVTDSPYGINREGIEQDDPEGLRALFDGCLTVMPIENGVVINFQSPRLFPDWLDAIRAAGHQFERALWSYKPNGIRFPWRGWILKSDIILISSIGDPVWSDDPPNCHDTYTYTHEFEIKQTGGWHGSVKPLAEIENIIGHTTGDVYEPFSGSGTTLVACENLRRRCRAIEISPAYVAVALERMSAAFPSLEIKRLE
jgi:DNA modification methylase